MVPGLIMRASRPQDRVAIESLYPLAFPDEDLLPLVNDLLAEPDRVMSHVATFDDAIVGHAAWTFCTVADQGDRCALLGPLAVTPARQKQGIGSSLVEIGFILLRKQGVRRVFVLGDPQYYSRLGFGAEDQVEPPYPLPAEWAGAWQSVEFGETETPLSGRLSVPECWQKPALWGP